MHKLHQWLRASSSGYSEWHDYPHRNAHHMVAFVAIAALSGGVMLNAIDTSAYSFVAPQGPAKAESAPEETTVLLRAVSNYAHAEDISRAALRETVLQIAEKRKNTLVHLMQQNPSQVLLAALPQDVVDRLPAEVQPYVESEVSLTGTLTVLHVDSDDKSKSTFEFQLRSQDSDTPKIYKLHFGNGTAQSQRTGATLNVKGVALGDDVAVAGLNGSVQTVAAAPAATLSIGAQNTIVMMVRPSDFATTTLPFSQSTLNGIVFTDVDSVNAFYKEDSFNQTYFTGLVTPPLQIASSSYDYCRGTDGYWTIAAQADAAASSAGYDLSQYRRRVYIVPTGLCGGGLGMVGGDPSQAWIAVDTAFPNTYPEIKESIEHELGHNLGWWHASGINCGTKAIDAYALCQIGEYKDPYDPMGGGNNYYTNAYQANHSNAVHKNQIPWFSAANIQTVSSSGTYTISPIEVPATGIQTLVLAKKDTGGNYYIEYRQPIGVDATLPQGVTSGAIIHVDRLPTYTYPDNTALIDSVPGDNDLSVVALADGRSFQDSINGITITQTSHSASSTVLSVALANPLCVQKNPTVSFSPVTQSGTAGQKLTYTMTVTNNDTTACPPTTFSPSIPVLPAGWSYTSGLAVTVPPGAAANTTISITPPTSTLDGSYGITEGIQDNSLASHAGSGSFSYVVFTPVSAPPSVVINSPKNGSIVSGSITIDATATDDTGVAKVEFYIDAAMVVSDKTAPYSYKWNTTKVKAGLHTIAAKAYDTKGNTSTATITVTK